MPAPLHSRIPCPPRQTGGEADRVDANAWDFPTDAPTWASRLSAQLAEVLCAIKSFVPEQVGAKRPVLTLAEAQEYCGCKSVSAFYRWLANWAPRASCAHGRYTRSALALGRDREAMQSRRRRGGRVAQIAARKAPTAAIETTR